MTLRGRSLMTGAMAAPPRYWHSLEDANAEHNNVPMQNSKPNIRHGCKPDPRQSVLKGSRRTNVQKAYGALRRGADQGAGFMNMSRIKLKVVSEHSVIHLISEELRISISISIFKKEAPVNFLTDPLEERSTLRPADILVFGWAGGKHACVDLTGVSPLVGLRDNGFVAGQAALKAESSKVAKHKKACFENQHVFIPFAFDTFGFLASKVEEFLNRVQRVVQSNFSTPKTQNFIFSRIGFAIQKGVAAQLVARLPDPFIETLF
ncbi:hypothetical protein Tco_0678600 [Tanacetum coccineum]|uniref:Reverse transcriptase domain-containing protein n=1 Tax=Tanacetum coccineum TaxID=301880 RepID=A0ABQ4XGU7_9ASTR